VFGQITYSLTDRLAITAGVRDSKDTTSFKVYNFLALPAIDYVVNETRTPPAGDFKDGDVTPNASLTMKWTPDFMTYLSAAKGYKAGGFDRAMSSGELVIPFQSETDWSYEAGFKSEAFDHHLRLNVSVFYIDISNQQLLAVVQLPGQLPATQIFNVGKSRSQGVEMELAAKVLEHLTFSADAGYTDAKFVQYIDPDGNNRAGDRLPQIPEITASASVEYRGPAWTGKEWSLKVSDRYIGGYQSGVGTEVDPAFNLPAYDIADIELALHPSSERWTAALFCRNALDTFARITTKQAAYESQIPAHTFSQVLPPRTVGANVTYHW
jgi:iron complex outermembrane receptor protein